MSANKTWLSNLIFQLIEQFQILHDHHRKTFDEFPSIISAVNERCRRLSFASMFRRLFSSSFSTNFLTRFDSTLLECSRSLRRYFAGETLVAFFKSLPPGFALHSLIDLSLLFSFFFSFEFIPKAASSSRASPFLKQSFQTSLLLEIVASALYNAPTASLKFDRFHPPSYYSMKIRSNLVPSKLLQL